MMGLRLAEGVDLARLAATCPASPARIPALEELGLVARDGGAAPGDGGGPAAPQRGPARAR